MVNLVTEAFDILRIGSEVKQCMGERLTLKIVNNYDINRSQAFFTIADECMAAMLTVSMRSDSSLSVLVFGLSIIHDKRLFFGKCKSRIRKVYCTSYLFLAEIS